MDWFVRWFVKASLAWLGLGGLMGLLMALHPQWIVYRPAHVHMNLLGFVTMMIFGVGYHVLPRFSGHVLASRRWAGAQWWFSNAGLALMVTGFLLAPHIQAVSRAVLGLGGSLSGAGVLIFIVNIWRTLDGPPVVQPIVRQTTT